MLECGCTCTAAIIQGKCVYLADVGDSGAVLGWRVEGGEEAGKGGGKEAGKENGKEGSKEAAKWVARCARACTCAVHACAA